MKVKKRTGEIVNFDFEKIIKAIEKAYKTTNQPFIKIPDNFDLGFDEAKDLITVEEIQDKVEKWLMQENPIVAKEYILYREKHSESRFIRERLDYMEKYSHSDNNAASASETDANANVSLKNVANLEGEVYKTTNRIIQRQRMKNKLYELFPEVAKNYEEDLNNHIIYTNDEASSPSLKNYCMAATLYPLMLEGTGNIDGVTPTPPNDIQSFSGQVTNLVFLLSSQVRGAVALGDYFIALNYYVVAEYGKEWYKNLDKVVTQNTTKDRTVKDMIRKGMKAFIYGVNQPAGNRSYNSPFSNCSYYDSTYFNALFEDFYYPDGTKPEWPAIDKLQRIFMELHRELRLIKPLTFPVTTLAMVHDNNNIIDKEYKELCAEEWSKGGSFFCFMSDSPTSLSSCCRVLNEIKDNTFSSTIGLTGIMTGSSNVITLNLNRIVQNWKREFPSAPLKGADDSLQNYLINILERVYKYQIAFKYMLYDMEDAKMFSSSNAGYIYTKKLYSTIGLLGYCEAAEALGYTVSRNEEYFEFLQLIFGTVKEQNKLHSIHDKKRPVIFNSEAVPGENMAVKFYEWDKKDGLEPMPM